MVSNKLCLKKNVALWIFLAFLFVGVVVTSGFNLRTKATLNSRASYPQTQVGGIGQPCNKGICSTGLICYKKPGFFKDPRSADSWLETECNTEENLRGKELYKCRPDASCNNGLTCRDMFLFYSFSGDMQDIVSTTDSNGKISKGIDALENSFYQLIDIGKYATTNKLLGSDISFPFINYAVVNDLTYVNNGKKLIEEIESNSSYFGQNDAPNICIPQDPMSPLSLYLDTYLGKEGYTCKPGNICNQGLACQHNIAGCPLGWGIGAATEKILTDGLQIVPYPKINIGASYDYMGFTRRSRCYSLDRLTKAYQEIVSKDPSAALPSCRMTDVYTLANSPTQAIMAKSTTCGTNMTFCCDNPWSTRACDDMTKYSCVERVSGSKCLPSKEVIKTTYMGKELDIEVKDYYYDSITNETKPIPIHKSDGSIYNYTLDRSNYDYPIIINPDKNTLNFINQENIIQLRGSIGKTAWKTMSLMEILGTNSVGLSAYLSINRIFNTIIISDEFVDDQYEQSFPITGYIDCGDGINHNAKIAGRFIYNESSSSYSNVSNILLFLSGYEERGRQRWSLNCNWDWGHDYTITLKKMEFAKDYLGKSNTGGIILDNLAIQGRVKKFTKSIMTTDSR